MSDLDYKIGVTVETMESAHELCDAPPQGRYYPWGQEYYGADGRTHGDGAAQATWSFVFIPQSGVQALRELCEGKSALVFIKTRTDDKDTFKIFSAIMHWPGNAMSKRISNGVYQNFTVEFTRLEEVEEEE